MPQPTSSAVHTDAILTNISVAYVQREDRYLASKIFPIIPVEKQSDKYYTYTKGDWFRDEAERRGASSESAGSGYTLSTATYSCDVFAFHKDIPDQVRRNTDAPMNPDREATQFVTQRLLLRLEKQWVSDFFATGIWDTDSTPTNLWSNYATSDPITDVEAGKEKILLNTGFMPNKLVLGYQVMRQLKHHPDIVDRFKYTTSANVTADILARLFEVDQVLVSMAVNNTAAENETNTFAFTHGKHGLLCYSNPTPGLMAPSAGYIFAWRGVSDNLGTDIGVSRIRMDLKKADRIEGEMAFDDKVVAADLGYFFNGAVA